MNRSPLLAAELMSKPAAALRSQDASEMVAHKTASAESLRERVAELECAAGDLENQLLAYEEVFFGNPVPALVYAADSLAILEANNSALALYGYEQEHIRSLNLLDLFSKNDQKGPELEAELRRPSNTIGPVVAPRSGGARADRQHGVLHIASAGPRHAHAHDSGRDGASHRGRGITQE